MKRVITIDRSLMFVQERHIDRFYSIAEKMEKYCYIIENDKVTPVDDAWNLVFNVWVLLLPDKFKIIQSVEKLLYYSANFIVLEALESDKFFQVSKKRSNGNEELTFLSALKIAFGLWNWSLYVLDKHNLNDIVERNKMQIYHESHKKTNEEIERYLLDQSRFTKAIVKEMNSTQSFQEVIKKYSNEAYAIYDKDFVNDNDH